MSKESKKGIKSFFRQKLDKWSEKVWWENYVNAVIQGDLKEILQTKEPRIVKRIIQWSACKEPMGRFASVLKKIGISCPVYLGLSPCNDKDRIILEEISSHKRWKLYMTGSCNDKDDYDELELKNNETEIHFIRTQMEDFYFMVDNSDDGILIKLANNGISISKWDTKRKEGIIEFEATEAARISNILLIEQDKRIREKITEIYNSVPESDIYSYYCRIKEAIKEFYDLSTAEITVKVRNMMISSKKGKLSEYKDNLIEINKNEDGWSRKIYSDSVKRIAFENDTIKTSGVSIDKLQETVLNANTIIKAIEKLEF